MRLAMLTVLCLGILISAMVWAAPSLGLSGGSDHMISLVGDIYLSRTNASSITVVKKMPGSNFAQVLVPSRVLEVGITGATVVGLSRSATSEISYFITNGEVTALNLTLTQLQNKLDENGLSQAKLSPTNYYIDRVRAKQ